MNDQLPLSLISPRTISNLEAGEEVDAHFYWSVLTVLGLHTPPFVGPRPDQPAGAWVRELRECRGFSKATFCGCTREPACRSAAGGVVLTRRSCRASRTATASASRRGSR